jgi:hypothetical protein
MKSLHALFALFALLFAVACGSREAEPAPAEQAPAPAEQTPVAAKEPAADPHAEHAAAAPAVALPTLAPEAKVFFGSPADGATVVGALENGKVMVQVAMGASGVAIKPAGPLEDGSGHHHVLIDTPAMPAGEVVPKDEQHVHFGLGQTEASLPLAIGPHTLTLQLADGIHRSYGEGLSASIKITVAAAGSVPAAATNE